LVLLSLQALPEERAEGALQGVERCLKPGGKLLVLGSREKSNTR
jgi:ubiquinone/menaquinone biosynthesis C-methylase UbiE